MRDGLSSHEGWRNAVLGDVAEFLNGYAFKPSDFTDDGLPVVRIKQLINPSAPVDRFRLDRGLWASLKSWGAMPARCA